MGGRRRDPRTLAAAEFLLRMQVPNAREACRRANLPAGSHARVAALAKRLRQAVAARTSGEVVCASRGEPSDAGATTARGATEDSARPPPHDASGGGHCVAPEASGAHDAPHRPLWWLACVAAGQPCRSTGEAAGQPCRSTGEKLPRYECREVSKS
ncbi:hypothetical protein AB1Y20_019003 [Prymnesium parvum]|uniref:Uncharacterized protein n=1 Tax=Prymnesium parvum TaxID=97485 RepID=A0AB34JT82_PRYPA